MDILKKHLGSISIPQGDNKVYKDECVYSFDNPESPTGLYISLISFIGLGRAHLMRHFQKTNESVYLHIKRERHEVSSPPQGDGPEKKITRLAIGVEGGFDPESGRKKFEFEDIHNIVLLPDLVNISWPNESLPEIVRQSVQAILDSPSAGKLAELEALAGTWDGETRIISKHANSLLQLETGKKIPPSGWVCEKCDKTENLWMNLTDGTILCGRKFYDGSGGNNHAVQHYEQMGYPLAVKLGTITKDGKADIFSYSEDDLVEDPKLNEHLSHWGINVANMEKTEKSMIELELELNQKTNEWAALQESGGQLTPIYGPGYTGMTNLGNSCYLNSVMQMLFSLPTFLKTYVNSAEDIFNNHVTDPAEDFNIQMAKLGAGLSSGKYAQPPETSEPPPPGVSPAMFKTLIGRGHPEFSSKKQQDAQEYLLHLINLIERNSNFLPENPSYCFKFKVEERVQCNTSDKVKYTERSDNILALNIPMEAAINKEEVAAYEAKKADFESQGKRMDPENLVRPKIKFFSCLELFMQTEIIDQFYSTAINGKTTARKTTRLSTFPDFLIIQLKKFTLREDWVPIKLDVAVEMPDILDLSPLRAAGLQPGEEILPEISGSVAVQQQQQQQANYDQAVVTELINVGFPENACKRALYFTQNTGLEPAMRWIMEHITDSDFADPFMPPGLEKVNDFIPDDDSLVMIMSMGFTRNQALKALEKTSNNVERAVDWIFSHKNELEETTSSPPPPNEIKDGDEHYKLVAFISHMGTSSMVGHYVVHILKDGHWVIYNDNKVALSEHPPKELAYLYLYERL